MCFVWPQLKSADIQCYNAPIDSKRQELLVTHLLNIMAFPLQLKIRTMTAMTVTVLRNLKEPCGTWSVIAKPRWLLSLWEALIVSWWSQLVSLERLPLLCEESWDKKQTDRVLELGLNALCRHNFGRNVIVGALSIMPVSEWAFFQHKENNNNNYNNDIEINIFITVTRNFHYRVLLVRMQQIQRSG